MTTSDKFREMRIPLNHGSGAIPAVGFGTLIPIPSPPGKRPRRHWRQDFAISMPRSAIATKMPSARPCRRCSRRARSGATRCS